MSGCSGDEEPQAKSATPKGDHVWKQQVQAIDKARDVSRQVGEAAARQQKAAEKAAQ
jgi:hypothetical protein